MKTSREAIMAALCACLATAQFAAPINGRLTWALLSRRLRLWSDVSPVDQPALFVAEHAENIVGAADMVPAKTMMNVDLFIYIAAGKDPSAIPASALNIALDALAASLAPPPGSDRQTLGGLVAHCRIDGRIVKDPGDLDGQGLAIVPVKILAP